MKLHHSLICFFLLSLQDGNIGFISAQLFYQTVIEGARVEIECPSSSASSRKFFCKERCTEKDILIDTEAVSHQSGRFSIQWKERRGTSFGDVLVTMSELTKSDSGLYRCGVGLRLSSAKYEIIVVDALLDKNKRKPHTLYAGNTGNITVACYFPSSLFSVTHAFLCGTQCLLVPIEKNDHTVHSDRYTIRYVEYVSGRSVFVSISHLNKSDSGRYRCGFMGGVFPDLERTFEVNVSDEISGSVPLSTTPSKDAAPPESPEQAAPSTSDILLYVGVTLVALVVLLSLALLIYCRRKSSKPEEPPEETEYASISEAKYTKPNKIELRSEDSSVPGSNSQSAAEEDQSKLTYSEIHFSERTVRSPNSAPSGHADTVIYSTPR